MKTKSMVLLVAAVMALGFFACYYHSGHKYYLGAPEFSPTHPNHVQLLRHEPKRPHVQLGEVWIRPEPGMSPSYVENSLRERAAAMGADAVVIVIDRFYNRYVVQHYWHGRRAYRERVIVGVAIHYK